jgi:hypothetical protein
MISGGLLKKDALDRHGADDRLLIPDLSEFTGNRGTGLRAVVRALGISSVPVRAAADG